MAAYSMWGIELRLVTDGSEPRYYVDSRHVGPIAVDFRG